MFQPLEFLSKFFPKPSHSIEKLLWLKRARTIFISLGLLWLVGSWSLHNSMEMSSEPAANENISVARIESLEVEKISSKSTNQAIAMGRTPTSKCIVSFEGYNAVAKHTKNVCEIFAIGEKVEIIVGPAGVRITPEYLGSTVGGFISSNIMLISSAIVLSIAIMISGYIRFMWEETFRKLLGTSAN